MKKIFYNYAGISAMTVIAAMAFVVGVFYGCQDKLVDLPNTVPDGLKSYFSSQDYYELKDNFDFGVSDFSFDDIIEENPVSELTIYYVPIKKKDRIGTLAVCSKNNGEVFKSLFSDESQTINQEEGVISIYTAKNFFVVDYKFEKQGFDDTSMKMKIDRVGNFSIGSPRLKGGTEFPSPDDGWWTCTTNCYAYAMAACGDDSECKFLCDLANIAGLCTLSVAAACAIYCI